MSPVEFMVWTWVAWIVSAFLYISHLRTTLRIVRFDYAELMRAFNEAVASNQADEIAADRDQLLDALYEIVDERDPAAIREIACDVLDIPVWPMLKRAA